MTKNQKGQRDKLSSPKKMRVLRKQKKTRRKMSRKRLKKPKKRSRKK